MLIFCLAVAFVAAWAALYVLVLRPKLVAFRFTAGIYARLDALETGAWARACLWLKGIKVAIIGVLTSAAPVLAVVYEKVDGLDWSRFVADDKAKIIGTGLAILGVVGPMVMVALHNGALAAASAADPHLPDAPAPDTQG